MSLSQLIVRSRSSCVSRGFGSDVRTDSRLRRASRTRTARSERPDAARSAQGRRRERSSGPRPARERTWRNRTGQTCQRPRARRRRDHRYYGDPAHRGNLAERNARRVVARWIGLLANCASRTFAVTLTLQNASVRLGDQEPSRHCLPLSLTIVKKIS